MVCGIGDECVAHPLKGVFLVKCGVGSAPPQGVFLALTVPGTPALDAHGQARTATTPETLLLASSVDLARWLAVGTQAMPQPLERVARPGPLEGRGTLAALRIMWTWGWNAGIGRLI